MADTGEEQAPRRSGRPETRERIVAAADRSMRELGLANATTKRIARSAGVSEAALYKHFAGKTDLFLEVLRSRFPAFVDVLAALPDRAGRGTVAGNLTDLVGKAVPFYRHGVPMLGSLFADPELLQRHREDLGRTGAGPMNANRLLAAYITEEQRLGRVPPDTAPDAVAALLLGACFQRAFFEAFLDGRDADGDGDGGGPDGLPPVERFAQDLVAGLVSIGAGAAFPD
ncbi:TetR/AcrR family transcriptional regulator [Streptomonospora salina]|uniref:AcrR family transcriptional regulator n=1 Tax=Streptomonospora salina TaxID=104205 RepID=A0A841EFL0_9ACTN|nr:TetR/AcrR family transcriptional regulator [Streptomonospora salina]MBB5998201.1 AcrR family transcriptional regulator [Streptomonospora salina]